MQWSRDSRGAAGRGSAQPCLFTGIGVADVAAGRCEDEAGNQVQAAKGAHRRRHDHPVCTRAKLSKPVARTRGLQEKRQPSHAARAPDIGSIQTGRRRSSSIRGVPLPYALCCRDPLCWWLEVASVQGGWHQSGIHQIKQCCAGRGIGPLVNRLRLFQKCCFTSQRAGQTPGRLSPGTYDCPSVGMAVKITTRWRCFHADARNTDT